MHDLGIKISEKDFYFISYNSEDIDRVRKIMEQLAPDDFPVWYDKLGLHHGERWATTIAQKIREAKMVILFYSNAILEKGDQSYVRKEYRIAKRRKTPVIIVQLDPIDFDKADDSIIDWLDEIDELHNVLVQNGRVNKEELYRATNYACLPSEKDAPVKTLDSRITFLSDSTFTLEYFASLPNVGTYYYNNSIYYGQLKEGQPHGKGILIWHKDGQYRGERYEGDFVEGSLQGKGVYYWTNGDYYEGDFVDDVKTGKGTYYWTDGGRYTGDFKNNNFYGKGARYWSNGNYYEGDFVDDKRTGKGVFVWNDGDRYEGDFVDDYRTGYGILYWSNGDRYEGEWLMSKRHGKGTYYWADGYYEDRTYIDDVAQ